MIFTHSLQALETGEHILSGHQVNMHITEINDINVGHPKAQFIKRAQPEIGFELKPCLESYMDLNNLTHAQVSNKFRSLY